MINNLCSLHLDINYLSLPNGEVENPKLLFLPEALKNKQKLSELGQNHRG